MKRIILYSCIALFVAGCTNNENKGEAATTDTTSTTTTTTETTATTYDYPFTTSKPYRDWQIGNQSNSVTVLKMLKAWESKNLTEAATYFGDTVNFTVDMYHAVLPHDSVLKMLESSWADYASVKLQVEDWVPVISKDKSEEWVTVWYKQSWVDKNGKADSMNCVNDAKMLNGKIVLFDEKIQHYPAKKI